MKLNCSNCKIFDLCSNKKKGSTFWCESHKVDPLMLSDILETKPNTDKSLKELDRNKFSILDSVNEALDSNKLVPSDIRLPERDFPEAPNFVEFCLNSNFLNVKPFVRQLEIATKLFAEWCPKCTDVDYFIHGGLQVTDSVKKFRKRVALLEHGVCPHCKSRKSELILEGDLNFYEELAVSSGQRSGKSALLAMMYAYITHRIIKAQRLVDIYGLLNSTTLVITFTAMTLAQVKIALWDPYHNYVSGEEDNWFKHYNQMLLDYTRKTGEELLRIKDTFILYKHRKLMVMMNTPDTDRMRGATRIAACIEKSSKVNTTKGLVKIEDVSIGDTIFLGNKKAKVSNKFNPGKLNCISIESCLGNKITVSIDHKMVVYRDSKLLKVRAKDILNSDKLCIVKGGSFPKSNVKFDYKFERKPTILEKMVDIAASKHSFDSSDFASIGDFNKGSFTKVTSRLVNRGYLDKHYRTGSMYKGMVRCFFTKTSLFDSDFIKSTRNKAKYTRDFIKLPIRMTNELSTLLGYFIADGSVKDATKQGIGFGTTIKSRHKEFVKCFEICFGIKPLTYKEVKQSGKIFYKAHISYRPIIDFLRHIGLDAVYSADKSIPWSVLQSNKECVINFLRPLFSCDGGLSKKGNAWYLSTSIRLIRDIQLVALKLGFVPKARKRTKGSFNFKYTRKVFIHSLFFSKKDSFDFWNLIKFESKNQAKKSSQYLHRFPGLTQIKTNIFSADIKSIKLLKNKKEVYDLTIDEKSHTYVAEGFLTSNSIDELGRFNNDANNKKSKNNAQGVYEALQRSLRTVRSSSRRLIERGVDDILPGYFLNVSSPSSYRDKITSLVRESVGSNKILGMNYSTWEFNPTITKDDLSEEFRRDPVGAMCDYGAQPPLVSSPFIGSSESVVQNCTNKQNPIKITYKKKTRRDGTATLYAYPDKLKQSGKPSVLAIDAGEVNNSFALVGGSLDENGNPSLDLFVEIQTRPGVKLNHSKIAKELIWEIIDARNCVYVAADQWQSTKILDDIDDEFDIKVRKYSLKYTDMVNFKTYIEDGEISYPKIKWELDDILKFDGSTYPKLFKNATIEHFIAQCLTVQDTGTQVLKGENMTDDLFRAAALCFRMLVDEDAKELLEAAPEKEVKTQQIPLGIMKGFSGVSGNANFVSNNQGSTFIGITKQRK